jgi:putative acetyltransferase
MAQGATVDTERPEDIAAIAAVHTTAFAALYEGGGPYEASVVDRLRRDGDLLLSLVVRDVGQDIDQGVGQRVGRVVGHVAFCRLTARRDGETLSFVALAPLAILPSHHALGLGSALVRAGLSRLAALGIAAVVVRGHPDYYPRFGFSARLADMLDAPWSGPTYMALELQPGAISKGRVHVQYPKAFKLPE